MKSGNNLAGNTATRARYERFGTRLWFGLICSLAAHGLLLSLQFGIPGLGLPGLTPPWAERRALMPELSVTLAGAERAENIVLPPSQNPDTAATPPQPSAPSGALQMVPPVRRAPTVAAPVRSERRKPGAKPKPSARQRPAPPILARSEPSPDSFVVPAPEPNDRQGEPTAEEPPVLAKEAPAPEPEPAQAEAPVELKQPEAQVLASADNARLAKELEAQKQEEAKKIDEARKLQEARKQQEANKAEEARRVEEANIQRRSAEAEARKREEQAAARLAQERAERKALELEARRKAEESARQQAAALERQKQAEQLAAKAKADELAARLKAEEAARQKQAEQLAAQQADLAERQRADAAAAQQREQERRAAQQAQAQTEAAAAAVAAAAAEARTGQKAGATGALAGGDLASKALSQVRTQDLTRAEPHGAVPTIPANPDRSSRRSIFGKIDNDIGLSMYIDGWRMKIERNGRLNYSQSSRDRARGDPIVTVAIRSDGSVEDIVINRSSGLPELDEAVRRIIRLNARYAGFPPALARRYDVIEIRRIWSFEESLRILEELETH